MENLINGFPRQLKEAIEIGRKAQLKAPGGPYSNVVVTGLGGSGIGGRIAAQLVAAEAKCPIEVYSNYYLPAYVNHKSLVIACSYSGNTEETIAAMEQALAKGARVCVVTSGGTMLDMAKERGLDHIVIPGGSPPRTMLAYSLTQQFFILHHFGIIGDGFEGAMKNAALMLDKDKEDIKKAAMELTEKLVGKRLVIYSEASTEAVSIRFRQQVNENSKELCWHHAIPEMNHNELVGWAGADKNIAVVIFRHKEDHERSQMRMEINKGIFEKYTPNVFEVWSKGDTTIARQLYLINLGDWVSLFWAQKKGVDPSEIAVINMLKGKLAEVRWWAAEARRRRATQRRMTYKELSSCIISGAIEVHKELGPGLLEGVYELCLVQVLRDMGLNVETQVAVPIHFRGKALGTTLRLDILVEDRIILEVKSVEGLHDTHLAQLLTYLKMTKCKLGLLINFNEALLKNGLRRVVNGLDEE